MPPEGEVLLAGWTLLEITNQNKVATRTWSNWKWTPDSQVDTTTEKHREAITPHWFIYLNPNISLVLFFSIEGEFQQNNITIPRIQKKCFIVNH